MRAFRAGALSVGVLALGGTLFSASQSMVLPLLPAISTALSASAIEISWLVTAPLIAAAAFTPTLGRLADRHGRKPILLVTMGMLGLGSLVVALASVLPVLVLGRFVQGVGGAFVPVAISLLRDVVPPRRLAGAVATISSSLGVGLTLGIPVPAWLAHVTDWHFVFAAAAVLMFSTAILIAIIVPAGERTPSSGGFDVMGALTLGVILVSIMLGITNLGVASPLSTTVLVPVVVALAAIPIWVRFEKRHPSPIVDLRLAFTRMPLALNTISFLLGFSLFANILLTVQLLQIPAHVPWGFGLTLLEAGMAMMPAGLAVVVFAQLGGVLNTKFGGVGTLLIGALMVSLGHILHVYLPGAWGAVVALCAVSSGVALVLTSLPLLIAHTVPTSEMATANSMNVLIRKVGQAACSAFVAALLALGAVTVDGTAWPSRAAFDVGFIVACIAALAASSMTVALRRTR